MQDLFKPSIWLKEDVLAPMLGMPPGEDTPAPASGGLLGKNGAAPTSEDDPGTSTGPIAQNWEPRGKIVAIVEPSSPNVDW
jgi:hypothetical protein